MDPRSQEQNSLQKNFKNPEEDQTNLGIAALLAAAETEDFELAANEMFGGFVTF